MQHVLNWEVFFISWSYGYRPEVHKVSICFQTRNNGLRASVLCSLDSIPLNGCCGCTVQCIHFPEQLSTQLLFDHSSVVKSWVYSDTANTDQQNLLSAGEK